jgi:hypothetical protein
MVKRIMRSKKRIVKKSKRKQHKSIKHNKLKIIKGGNSRYKRFRNSAIRFKNKMVEKISRKKKPTPYLPKPNVETYVYTSNLPKPNWDQEEAFNITKNTHPMNGHLINKK